MDTCSYCARRGRIRLADFVDATGDGYCLEHAPISWADRLRWHYERHSVLWGIRYRAARRAFRRWRRAHIRIGSHGAIR